MKPYIPLTFVFCWCFATLTVQAQNNTEKTVTDATQALGTLKGLFGKKKAADKKDASSTTPNAPNTKQANNNTTAVESVANGNNPRVYFAGNASAKTKVIDCDEMWPYNLGAAKIKKGQSYALIDSAGNFIVPFNKYTNIDETISVLSGPRTGIYKVVQHNNNKNTDNDYYINSLGKVLWDITANKYNTYNDYMSIDGQFIMLRPIKKDEKNGDPYMATAIDKNGKQYHFTLKDGAGSLQDSVIVFMEQVGSNYLYGFKNLNNVTIVKPTFTKLDNFSDGVAVFEVKDQFGESKGGIINNKGKIIVPPTWPSGSYYRVASVNGTSDIVEIQGTGNTDYYFEYLNAVTGKVIFKTTQNKGYVSYAKLFVFPNSYVHSNYIANEFLIDPVGNILYVNDLMKKLGVKFGGASDKYKFCAVSGGLNNLLFFNIVPNNGSLYMRGIYNIPNENIIIGPFLTSDHSSVQADFDPVSHLSMVRFETDKKDNLSHTIYLLGYMNTRGELVILKSNN